MKATGIVRKVDELGRVVIPKEIRDTNNWATGQPMEMFVDDKGGLYIRAYGKEAEKQEILDQLQDVLLNTENKASFQIISNAIEFIENK